METGGNHSLQNVFDADNDDPSQNAGDGEYSTCPLDIEEKGGGDGKEEQQDSSESDSSEEDEEEQKNDRKMIEEEMDSIEKKRLKDLEKMYSMWRAVAFPSVDCQNYAARGSPGGNEYEFQEDSYENEAKEEEEQQQQQEGKSGLYGLMPDHEDGYCLGEELFSYCHRPLACRKLVETLVQLTEKQDDVLEVFEVVEKLSYNSEPCLGADLIEHVPHFAMVMARYYHGKPDQHCFIAQRIVPLLVRFLVDTEPPQVRKSSEEVLRLMRQQNLIDEEVVKKKICLVIINTTYSPDSITRMTKMVPVCGREAAEEYFVPKLVSLSSELDVNIRRACVANFGEYCATVSTQVMEHILLPCFVKLCRDKTKEVRKACAEVIMSVSCACRLETRKATLAPVCAELLADPWRWVRMSAFQTLGPFITTFAQPSITGLAYNQHGQLVLTNNSGFEFSFSENPAVYAKEKEPLTHSDVEEMLMSLSDESPSSNLDHNNGVLVIENLSSKYLNCNQEQDGGGCFDNSMKEREALPQEFDSFLYWRDPLPELENLTLADANYEKGVEEEELNGTLCYSERVEQDAKAPSEKACCLEQNSSDDNTIESTENGQQAETHTFQDYSHLRMNFHHHYIQPAGSMYAMDMDYKPVPQVPFQIPSDLRKAVLFRDALNRKNKPDKNDKPKQDIVPQELIEHFVSLSDPAKEFGRQDYTFLAYQIAYSLPAVALTLGRDNWVLLKGLYESLAVNTGWKVRRAVASSIHELAVILGEEAATQDLVPVFNGIIKDLDEVRIGALKHLANFLKRLKPAGRNSFLPKLAEFLMTDYDMNWRFREELAEQLLQMVGLFSPADTYTHLMPLATVLLLDKVAAVRRVALSLVTELVRCVAGDARLLHSMLVELAEQFAHSSLSSLRWRCRQTFALLCSQLKGQNVLPDEMFATIVLPHLIDLSWDVVPNVRLAVARTLASDIATHWYFRDPQNPHHDVVMQTLKRLQEDKDRDVRYMATYTPTQTTFSDNGSSEDGST